jgi:hypothetical protein
MVGRGRPSSARAHRLAVYHNYDLSGPLDLVSRCTEVADKVRK